MITFLLITQVPTVVMLACQPSRHRVQPGITAPLGPLALTHRETPLEISVSRVTTVH